MSEEKNPDWRENDAPKIPSIYSYPNKLDELLKDVKNYEDTMHTLFYKDDNGMMKEEKHEQLPDADKAKKVAYNVQVKNPQTGKDEWVPHTQVPAEVPTGLDVRPAPPTSGTPNPMNLTRPKKPGMGIARTAWNEVRPDGTTRAPKPMAPGETGHEGAFDKSLSGNTANESPADAFKRKYPDVKPPMSTSSPAPTAPTAPAKTSIPMNPPGGFKLKNPFGKRAEQKKMTTEDVKNLQGAELEKILKDSEAYEKYLGIANHDLPKLTDELVNTQEAPKDSDKPKIK